VAEKKRNQVGEMGLGSEKKRVVRAGETRTRDGGKGMGERSTLGKENGDSSFRSSVTYLYSLLWKFRFIDF
jgi:hypothetical protein